jgi:hypothetical protein
MNPGAALAAMRGLYKRRCAEATCRKWFSGIKIAKFCSNACRQRAKYTKAKGLRHDD